LSRRNTFLVIDTADLAYAELYGLVSHMTTSWTWTE